MKNITVLLLLLSTICISIKSQSLEKKSLSKEFSYFEKGKSIISIYSPINWAGYIGLIAVIGGRYSFFVAPKLNLGVESKFSTDLGNFKGVGIGSSTRYYLAKRRISPFIETNYMYEKIYISAFIFNFDSNVHRIRTLGGLSYVGIKEVFGVDFFIGAEKLYITMPSLSYKDELVLPTGGFRFNFYF